MAQHNNMSVWAVAGTVALCIMSGPGAAQEAAKQTMEQPLPSIVVIKAEKKLIVDRIVASGTIKAVEETYVSPLVDGLSIRSLSADVGDHVKADSTLAVLNEDTLLLQKSQYAASLAKANASLAQYKAQLAEAQANAEEADRVAERSRKLSEAGTISTAQRDQEQSAATVAKARVNFAEQQIDVANADIKVVEAQISDVALRLARTAVKSTVDGVVSAKTAKVGAIASGAAEPLFTIIRDGAVEMKADITEADLLKIAVGQKAKVLLAGGRTTVDGKVRLVSPMVDSQTRLGTVYISMAQPERARVGMYADVQIITEEKQAVTLPLTAVTSGNDKAIVRLVKGDIVHLVPVSTGIQDGKVVEISSGLQAGDEIVAKAGAYVRDGDRIKPVALMVTATN